VRRPKSATTTPDELVVRADPDKLFFIENLIKDIELIPAILDLADNSVDAARSLVLESVGNTSRAEDEARADDGRTEIDLPEGAFSGLVVKLSVTPSGFTISDNCGGIRIETAQKYAFRFGRSREFQGVPGSVGQFGVGMKRALFKLGRWFAVASRTNSESFVLEVDVDKWLNEQDELDWTFRFKEATQDLDPPDEGERGTTVEVRRLHKTVVDDFSDPLILSLLREQLRLRHQEALDRGLTMYLNGEKLSGLRPTLMQGPNFAPIRKSFLVTTDDGSVSVELIAGIVRSDRREASLNEGNAENFLSTSEAGWWVFCNNRLLLVADKSSETGWGKGAATYHPQYRLFRGYVYMSSLDTRLLPWNTTKTGVDSDSVVWRKVQSEMMAALAEVQAVINRLKKEREEAPDEEDEGAQRDAEEAPYTAALAEATPVPLRSVQRSSVVVKPDLPKKTKPSRRRMWQKMQYEVPRDQFSRAMEVTGFSTMAELGRKSFDYFYKREVED
jgi:hypothetical protein